MNKDIIDSLNKWRREYILDLTEVSNNTVRHYVINDIGVNVTMSEIREAIDYIYDTNT